MSAYQVGVVLIQQEKRNLLTHLWVFDELYRKKRALNSRHDKRRVAHEVYEMYKMKLVKVVAGTDPIIFSSF